VTFLTIVNWLPTMIAVESCWAAILYLTNGDWKHAGYWASAAAITFFVTMMS